MPNLDIGQLVIPGALAAALTFIVPLITRWNWPRWVKLAITAVLTMGVVAAVLIIFFRPDTWEIIVAVAGFAFGVGQIVYQLLKPTGIFDWIQAASSPVQARRILDDDTGGI